MATEKRWQVWVVYERGGDELKRRLKGAYRFKWLAEMKVSRLETALAHPEVLATIMGSAGFNGHLTWPRVELLPADQQRGRD